MIVMSGKGKRSSASPKPKKKKAKVGLKKKSFIEEVNRLDLYSDKDRYYKTVQNQPYSDRFPTVMTDQLRISWHDSTWIPHLNPVNILDYFCQKSNPFYDKLCNNEIAKMQNLSPEQRLKMTGKEYILLHVQEPVLYIIRKQDRLGPDSATPLEDYYVLAGVVYQAPDLNSILQSRVLNSALNLKSALEEFQSISTFHPSTGHSWKFQQSNKTSKTTERPQRPEEFTKFQMKVSNLIKNLSDQS